MIRPAMSSDIPAMLEMGRKFFDASGYSDITEYHEESFRDVLERLITSADSLALVADEGGPVGMAAALLYFHFFNTNHKTSQELFWYVDEKHRGIGTALLDALIAGVKAKGAQSVSMIALESLDPEKVSGIYARRGFRPSERTYVRSLAASS